MKRKSKVAIANQRTLLWSLAVIVVMFSFGYALAPFYDQICRALGIGGKTGRTDAEAVAAVKVDNSRDVTVEFTGTAMAGLPWEFRPRVKKIMVHPGEVVTINYSVRNPTAETMVGQAAPSVSPGTVGAYFKKIECFCFTQQKLAPGESREMPVRFYVDPALPRTVHTITLSYGFFNIDKAQAQRFGGAATSALDAGAHVGHAKTGS